MQIGGFVKGLLPGARKRAHRYNRTFSLCLDDLVNALEMQKYRCALTGLRFTLNSSEKGTQLYFREPYSPSIDRIDSGFGYCAENVRIVCYALNIALGEWGEEVFLKISRSYMMNTKGRDPFAAYRMEQSAEALDRWLLSKGAESADGARGEAGKSEADAERATNGSQPT
jgi:hypothetical protein